MKTIKIMFIILFASSNIALAQTDGGCSTPNLDSAFAVSLPYYDNTELLATTLQQDGYHDLEEVTFPTPPNFYKTLINR